MSPALICPTAQIRKYPIDYVITQLIHLIHPHYGQAFYDLLETLMPDCAAGSSDWNDCVQIPLDGIVVGLRAANLLCMGLFSPFW